MSAITVKPVSPWAAVASPRLRRIGVAVSGLAAAFLFFDGAARLVGFTPYAEGTLRAGYSASLGPWLGIVLIACAALYALPRTAPLGAILLTGYLGGAVATNLRLGDPIAFPVMVGLLVWGGLYLRERRLAMLLPLVADDGLGIIRRPSLSCYVDSSGRHSTRV